MKKCKHCSGTGYEPRDVISELSDLSGRMMQKFGRAPKYAYLGKEEVNLAYEDFYERDFRPKEAQKTPEEFRKAIANGEVIVYVQTGPLTVRAVDCPRHINVAMEFKT